MKKCLIYARQSSSTSETFSESVEYQIEKCVELAKKEGYEIAGIFRDLNVSGKTYPAGSEDIAKLDIVFQKWFIDQTGRKMFRDGLGNAIKLIFNENIDMIIVYDITRLYRPISGSFLESHISQILLTNGVKVLTVNNGIIDFGNFNDSLIMSLQNRINHEQISIQRKKSKAAINKLQDDGEYYPGLGKKLGFKWGRGKREIEINEEEAEVVKKAYKMVYDGYTLTNIVKEINTKYRIGTNKGLVNRHTITRTLKNPIYAGYIYNADGELVKSKQTDGFIDFSLWKEVKEIIEQRKTFNRRPKKTWLPLTGYVFCGTCGERLTTHVSSRSLKQYICESHNKIKKDRCYVNMCNSRDCAYGLGLIECIYPLLSLAALKEIEVYNSQSENRDKLNNLKIELTNIVEREKKLSEMFISGLLDENTLSISLKAIAEKKKSLNIEILNYENMLSSSNNSIDNQIQTLKAVVNRDITKEEYEKLLRKTIKSIHIVRSHIDIKTFYGDVRISRQHLANFKLLPHYFINMDSNHNINLIYYYGKERKLPEICADKELIADFGKMKIYYMK